jgi:hypothetical protein
MVRMKWVARGYTRLTIVLEPFSCLFASHRLLKRRHVAQLVAKVGSGVLAHATIGSENAYN